MNEHYIVAVDQGHLRIYLEHKEQNPSTAGLEPIEAMDFPAGKRAYFEGDTSPQGRFPDAGDRHPGMSIDERLPMKAEADRRSVKQLAAEIETFFASRPDATWDFAAGPELHRGVLDLLSPKIRDRLQRALKKDIVNQQPNELLAQVASRV